MTRFAFVLAAAGVVLAGGSASAQLTPALPVVPQFAVPAPGSAPSGTVVIIVVNPGGQAPSVVPITGTSFGVSSAFVPSTVTKGVTTVSTVPTSGAGRIEELERKIEALEQRLKAMDAANKDMVRALEVAAKQNAALAERLEKTTVQMVAQQQEIVKLLEKATPPKK